MGEKIAKRSKQKTNTELSSYIVNGKNIDEVLSEISKDIKEPDPKFIIIDLFCGAGGTTTGFEQALRDGNKIAKVIACVNHDHKAIKSHWKNNSGVLHFEEDIRKLNVLLLKLVVDHYKKLYPDAYVILWASLECTNFSKAKGGLPRDADSRTLALHLFKYIYALQPDFIQIENVVEFRSWGPMKSVVTKTNEGYDCCEFEFKETEEAVIGKDGLYKLTGEGDCSFINKNKPFFKGVPESRNNGKDWLRWCKTIDKIGYRNDWKELNSANFGAYTSRNRLFGCFAKPGLPIVWPEPTHAKNPSKHSMYGDLKKWKAVKEVLNFDDEGESIFDRKKPLSEKTLERIYAGLVKYVAKGDTAFISKYFSGRPANKNISVEGPAGTIKTVDGQALIQGEFLVNYNHSSDVNSIEDIAPAIVRDRLALVQGEFLAHYYGNGFATSTEDPCPALRGKAGQALIQSEFFIDKQFTGNGNLANHQSIEQPAGSILKNDKHCLIEAESFIMPTNYDNEPKSIDEPLQTITANRKHHYIVNPSWGGNPGSVEEPCCVVVARQDKAPLYFVQVESGPVAIAIYESDSPCMIKIKQFMAVFGLVDIKMRMLRVLELLQIQGFPIGYFLDGNQSDQKKFIGNSVVPKVVKVWCEAMNSKLIEMFPIRSQLNIKAA